MISTPDCERNNTDQSSLLQQDKRRISRRPVKFKNRESDTAEIAQKYILIKRKSKLNLTCRFNLGPNLVTQSPCHSRTRISIARAPDSVSRFRAGETIDNTWRYIYILTKSLLSAASADLFLALSLRRCDAFCEMV